MLSSVDKTKETKNLEGVEVNSSTPDKVKEKIIASSIKEEDKTSQDMIKIMRNKIVQSENSVVIESHEWEALYKMFQVLQIQSKDSDLDDDTLNIIQNMCNTLKINLKFTEDGSCVPIDFSDYEGDDIEVNIKPNTEVELNEELLADLVVVMDDYDREISASVKRINPTVHAKLEKITGEKLNTINKIDNCISLLVTIQYFDIEISSEMRENLKNVVDSLNDFVRDHTKETKKFYKKFNEIENKEEYTMAVTKRGSQREFKSVKRATRAATEAIKKDRKAKRKGEIVERKKYPGAYDREDRGKSTHEKNMEKLERLKAKAGKPANPYKKKGRDKDEDDDRRSSRREKSNNKEMDMEKTLKKVRKEYKDDLKDLKLLNDIDDLISDGDRVKTKDVERFLKDIKEDDSKLHKSISKMLRDVLDDEDDDRRSSRRDKDKKKSRRDRDEDDDDDRKSSRKDRDRKSSRKDRDRKKSRRDEDEDDDRRSSRRDKDRKSSRRDRDRDDDRRSSRRNKNKKKGGNDMLEYLDVEVSDVIDIINDIVDEHSKDIKRYSKDLLEDLKDVVDDLEDDDDALPKALGLLFVVGMNIKISKSILKDINKVFKNIDDEDDDRRSSRRDKDRKSSRRDRDRKKSRRSKDNDLEEVKELLEDIVSEHKRTLKDEKLLNVVNDIIDDIDDEEAKMKDINRLYEDLADIRDLKRDRLIKDLAKLVDSDDDDDRRSSRRDKDRKKSRRDRDDRDRKSSRKDRDRKKSRRSSEFATIGELLTDLKEDFEDELDDADLLRDVEDLIDDIESDDATSKDISKLIKMIKKEDDLDSARKIIKKITSELDEDEDDDRRSSRKDRDRKSSRKDRDRKKSRRDRDKDEDDDRRSSRRNKNKKGKSRIDFDDLELRNKDIREIEDLVDDSDLEKADKKAATKYIDKEDWEALYDLAKEEDSDLADDLKEIFRGLAREVESDFDDIKHYFSKDFSFIDKEDLDDIEFKIVTSAKEFDRLDLDENDSKFKDDLSEIIGMNMGDIYDVDKPKFNKDIKTIIVFTTKTANARSNRKNILTEEETED